VSFLPDKCTWCASFSKKILDLKVPSSFRTFLFMFMVRYTTWADWKPLQLLPGSPVGALVSVLEYCAEALPALFALAMGTLWDGAVAQAAETSPGQADAAPLAALVRLGMASNSIARSMWQRSSPNRIHAVVRPDVQSFTRRLKSAEPKLACGQVQSERQRQFWPSQNHLLSQAFVANG
jgi:hypothetical protein